MAPDKLDKTKTDFLTWPTGGTLWPDFLVAPSEFETFTAGAWPVTTKAATNYCQSPTTSNSGGSGWTRTTDLTLIRGAL